MPEPAPRLCRYCSAPVTRKPGAPRECRNANECRRRLACSLECCVQERPEMLEMFGTWDPGVVMLRVERMRETLAFVLERAENASSMGPKRTIPAKGGSWYRPSCITQNLDALEFIAAAARQALEGRDA